MNKKEFKKLVRETKVNVGLIPKQTPYCYSVDRDRIKTDKTLKPAELPITMCPYYVWGKGEAKGCIHTEFYGTDLLLWDQCKICGE